MKKLLLFFSLFLLFCGCASRHLEEDQERLACIQLMDRSGITETVSTSERLANYGRIDFNGSQPYRQVLRIFTKDHLGRSRSKITSYHPNGQIWQYLEGRDNRASGAYLEWHPSGKRKIEARVVEGPADLSELAQKEWIFDGICRVWDEEGALTAEILYEKGLLEGVSNYFYPNGGLAKCLPCVRDEIDGELRHYREDGSLLSTTFYEKGVKNGPSIGYWENEAPSFIESYEEGSLVTGIYWNEKAEIVAEIQNGSGTKLIPKEDACFEKVEIQNGRPEGRVECCNENGELVRVYYLAEGKKQGEELQFYLSSELLGQKRDEPLPKLQLHWDGDAIQGTVKTWYKNGKLESQKEFYQNRKNGMSCGWYEEGSILFVEEYENELLINGSYYKLKQAEPVSKIIQGNGIATLFDGKKGHFLRKIKYVNGKPQE